MDFGKMGNFAFITAITVFLGLAGWATWNHHDHRMSAVKLPRVPLPAVHHSMTPEQKTAAYTTLRTQYEELRGTPQMFRQMMATRAATSDPAVRQQIEANIRAAYQVCTQRVITYNGNAAKVPTDLLTAPQLHIRLEGAVPIPTHLEVNAICTD